MAMGVILEWDFVLQICSAMQLSGFFLCLMGAAKITHRAQGIVSIATRWHMLVTNASAELVGWKAHMSERLSSDTDSDDSSDIYVSVTPQRPSSFQTRQALGEYYVSPLWYFSVNIMLFKNVEILWIFFHVLVKFCLRLFCSDVFAAQLWGNNIIWVSAWSRVASYFVCLRVLSSALDSEYGGCLIFNQIRSAEKAFCVNQWILCCVYIGTTLCFYFFF